MTPMTAIKTCFSKYGDFTGRASRAEYWWFYLATAIAVYGTMALGWDNLSTLFWLATIVPWLAVTWRRLHDSDLAGPWIFISAALALVGIYGFMFAILFTIMPDMAGGFAGVDMSDDTTLGELREAMAENPPVNPFENFEWNAGKFAFIAIGASGVLLAIYLKTRPSTPGPNRFGPNPNEVPS